MNKTSACNTMVLSSNIAIDAPASTKQSTEIPNDFDSVDAWQQGRRRNFPHQRRGFPGPAMR